MAKRRRAQKKRKMRVVRDRKKMKERMNLDFQLRYNSQIFSLVEYLISPSAILSPVTNIIFKTAQFRSDSMFLCNL